MSNVDLVTLLEEINFVLYGIMYTDFIIQIIIYTSSKVM